MLPHDTRDTLAARLGPREHNLLQATVELFTHRRVKMRPGGVLLLTEAGITPTSTYDSERWGEYWRFTSQSIERLLAQELPGARCEVRADGNVLVASAFLYGISAAELEENELDHCDPDYEVVISAVATKPS